MNTTNLHVHATIRLAHPARDAVITTEIGITETRSAGKKSVAITVNKFDSEFMS